MMNIKSLSFLAICMSNVYASELTVALFNCKGDTDVIKMDSGSITCDGSYCDWGSTAKFYGAFTIGSELSTSVADISAKGFGYSYLYNGELDICDFSTENGCPGVGTYTFSTDVTLPDSPNTWWYNNFIEQLYAGKTEITFDFDDDVEVTCKFKVYHKDSNYLANASAVLFVGAAAFFGMKRRRLATEPSGLLNGEVASNFEMMEKDQPGIC